MVLAIARQRTSRASELFSAAIESGEVTPSRPKVAELGGLNEIDSKMGSGALRGCGDRHHDLASRASILDVFRSRRMWTELCQGGGVVGNLARVLGNSKGLGVAEALPRCG